MLVIKSLIESWASSTTATTSTTSTTTKNTIAYKNLKDEIVSHIGVREVFCMHVLINTPANESSLEFILHVGYTEEDWKEFLEKVDVDYRTSVYEARISATIWYKDMSWSRRIYPYAHFEYMGTPEIPFKLWRNIEKDGKI